MQVRKIAYATILGMCGAAAVGQVPGPPPVPPHYNMGSIVNGDFEANGGSLDGWAGGRRVVTVGADHVAWLDAIGFFDPEWGWMEGVETLSQRIIVPSNATYLTFVFSLPSVDGFAEVWIGGHDCGGLAGPSSDWSTATIDVSGFRGQPVDLTFQIVAFLEYDLYLDYVGFDAPGSTPINPMIPSVVGSGAFQFTNVYPGQWYDPPFASAFEYTMNSASLFTKILDFPPGFGPLTVMAEGRLLGTTYGPGTTVDFTSVLGHGVPAFRIVGISPTVDAGDPTAFPLQLDFDTPAADFTMRALGLADLDRDGDVDLGDFSFFQMCFNGPNRPPTQANCSDADLDSDGDVDLADFGVFQSCFNGPNRPPACQ
jgi:hypothetical protein